MINITAEMVDGTKFEAAVPEKSYMGLGDRVAFERRYGTSTPAVLADIGSMFIEDEDGERQVDTEADLSTLREEHVLFFSWRGLSRGADGVPDFDEFADQVADVEVAVDPTEGPEGQDS